MDDGGFTENGLKLFTNAFNPNELYLLVESLNTNFSILFKKVQIKTNKFRKYKKKKNKGSCHPLVRDLVKEFMHPTMMYKLNESSQ
jgi:hypothetical protein